MTIAVETIRDAVARYDRERDRYLKLAGGAIAGSLTVTGDADFSQASPTRLPMARRSALGPTGGIYAEVGCRTSATSVVLGGGCAVYNTTTTPPRRSLHLHPLAELSWGARPVWNGQLSDRRRSQSR